MPYPLPKVKAVKRRFKQECDAEDEDEHEDEEEDEDEAHVFVVFMVFIVENTMEANALNTRMHAYMCVLECRSNTVRTLGFDVDETRLR